MLWFIFSVFSLLFAYLGKSLYNQYPELSKKGLEVHKGTLLCFANNRCFFYRCALAVCLSFFIAIVSPSGTDHHNYVDMYAEYDSLDTDFSILGMITSYNIEIGYQLLNFIGNILNLSIPMFFFFVALIINSLFVSVIYRFKYPTFAILVFILSMTFGQEVNIVRQCLSIAIFAYSIKFLDRKESRRYIVAILLAFSFHSSAIFLLPLVILCWFDWQKYDKTIHIGIYLLWAISLLSAFKIINFEVVGNIVSILGDSRYVGYAENMGDMGFVSVINYFNIFVVIVLYFFTDKKKNIYLYLFIFGCILQNFSTNLLFLMRFSMYFMAISPLFMGEVVNHSNYKNKYKKIIQTIYSLFVLYFIYNLMSGYVLGSPAIGKECYSLANFF